MALLKYSKQKGLHVIYPQTHFTAQQINRTIHFSALLNIYASGGKLETGMSDRY